ncbi:unnamed protein product [Vitrella brassicaformis CCMP3155]|uniref:Reelin domain-containing protein n=1 Tax=Vitrella brassicaformis (strain CCMP3155) TaxID=1169540 RepID=A0A0G4F4R5_VITBC|nr:unnamed protein product [Vitrella brassicaformis CCMP3155]|eukprot:CEM06814.1 unnamed protein product [Vitrella brassicaformis CCMP3155]
MKMARLAVLACLIAASPAALATRGVSTNLGLVMDVTPNNDNTSATITFSDPQNQSPRQYKGVSITASHGTFTSFPTGLQAYTDFDGCGTASHQTSPSHQVTHTTGDLKDLSALQVEWAHEGAAADVTFRGTIVLDSAQKYQTFDEQQLSVAAVMTTPGPTDTEGPTSSPSVSDTTAADTTATPTDPQTDPPSDDKDRARARTSLSLQPLLLPPLALCCSSELSSELFCCPR